jgi:hypothetical protein
MKFEKGKSGNPKGRKPLGKTLTEVLRRYGEAAPEGSDMARKELLARELWAIALAGDISAIKYIYDRVDGKPTESVEHSGPGGDSIKAVITWKSPGED